MKNEKRIFFLTGEWDGLARFVRGKAHGPEGTPSAYLPWIRYRERGYDVHIFMEGDFENNNIIDFQGCKIHLVNRGVPSFFRKQHSRMVNGIALRKAAIAVGDRTPPQIVYALREGKVRAASFLGKRYGCVTVKRIFGTFFYDWWFVDKSIRKRLACLKGFAYWLWPADLMIITDDGTNGARIAEFLKIDKKKYRVWRNGVFKDWSNGEGDAITAKRSLGLRDGSFTLLSLARLTKWKRHDRAIRAMPFILREIPYAELVIGGEGALRPELEELADRIGVHNAVHFPGHIQHSQVRNLMKATDVLLLPYDLTCVCSTLLEGLVCGKAIVAWDVGATRDVIVNKVNGFLLSDAKPEAFANAVISIAKDKNIRRTLESGALRYSQDCLQSWEERCDMEIDLVESIVSRRSAKSII